MPDENTVSVAAGSTTVLGHLTQFVGFAGDTFNCFGMSIPVAAVVSTSELTLAYGWPGADVVDSAAWVLLPTSAEWSSTVSLHKAIVEANAWRNGKFPFPFNNGGPISKRSLFDGEPMGFTFLELTGNQDDPFRLYGKLSDDSGDWSVGQTLRGDAALSTGQAIAAAALAQAWATQAAGEVEPGEGFSAKYHAGQAAGSAAAASASAGNAAGSAAAASGSAGASAGSAAASGNSAGAAAGSAIAAATARDLAQQWATKTDGDVVAGQGRGSKYYSEQAAAILAKSVRVDTDQTFLAAEKAQAQNNLGGTTVGRAVFAAVDDAAGRTALGMTDNNTAAWQAGTATGIGPVSPAQVKAAVDALSVAAAAARPYGSVGSYVFAQSGNCLEGATVAGSVLRPSGALNFILTTGTGSQTFVRAGGLSGTWRCMGRASYMDTGAIIMDSATLFLRIS